MRADKERTQVGKVKMPVKIMKKISYTLEIKLPSLELDKTLDVDEKELGVLFREVAEFHKILADLTGAVDLGGYKSPIIRDDTEKPSQASGKLMEYARTHEDFTIKNASECLNIPEKTLYSAASKLIDAGLLERTQVMGGIGYIYKLVKKTPPKEQVSTLTVLPNGKFPFPDRHRIDPEREKMQALRD